MTDEKHHKVVAALIQNDHHIIQRIATEIGITKEQVGHITAQSVGATQIHRNEQTTTNAML